MAATKSSGSARRATKTTGKATGKAAKATAGKAVKLTAGKALKVVGRKAVQSSARAVRALADRAAVTGSEALESGIARRPPVQVGIDVAVPITVAWTEWMASSSLPEGVHSIEDVERDGDELIGTVDGVRSRDWTAEITDDREEESFAWRSVEGSDCAGLVTFHRLSDRLTRIELALDVLPTSPAEAVALTLHLADRRAEAYLRRFKAHVEFINPDVYKADVQQHGGEPEAEEGESEKKKTGSGESEKKKTGSGENDKKKAGSRA